VVFAGGIVGQFLTFVYAWGRLLMRRSF